MPQGPEQPRREDEAPAAPSSVTTTDELDAWKRWWQSLGETASLFFALARAEFSLAAEDARRLLILLLLAIPLAILAWIGLGVLAATIVYRFTALPEVAAGTFLLLQLLPLLVIAWLVRRYQRSLQLPRTRKHLKRLMEDIQHGPPGSDSTHQ